MKKEARSAVLYLDGGRTMQQLGSWEVSHVGCPDTDREWEGQHGRVQVMAAGCVSSHLVEHSRDQAAKQLSKRNPFSFPYEIFSLLRRCV